MTAHEADPVRPLVSTATILILSGFLIGVALGNLMDPELSPFLLMCGVAGLLCYVVFEISNRRRLADLAQQGQREMEERLNKHLQPIGEPAAKAHTDAPADPPTPADSPDAPAPADESPKLSLVGTSARTDSSNESA
jgi:hypothetical protein